MSELDRRFERLKLVMDARAQSRVDAVRLPEDIGGQSRIIDDLIGVIKTAPKNEIGGAQIKAALLMLAVLVPSLGACVEIVRSNYQNDTFTPTPTRPDNPTPDATPTTSVIAPTPESGAKIEKFLSIEVKNIDTIAGEMAGEIPVGDQITEMYTNLSRQILEDAQKRGLELNRDEISLLVLKVGTDDIERPVIYYPFIEVFPKINPSESSIIMVTASITEEGKLRFTPNNLVSGHSVFPNDQREHSTLDFKKTETGPDGFKITTIPLFTLINESQIAFSPNGYDGQMIIMYVQDLGSSHIAKLMRPIIDPTEVVPTPIPSPVPPTESPTAVPEIDKSIPATALERARVDPLHQTQLTESEMAKMGIKGSALLVSTELSKTVTVKVIVNTTPDMLAAIRDMKGIELNPTIPGGGETPADQWFARAILGFHWAGYLDANPTLNPDSYTLDKFISELAEGKDLNYELVAVRDGIGSIGKQIVDPSQPTWITYYGDEKNDPFLQTGYVFSIPSGDASYFTVKVNPETHEAKYLIKDSIAISEQHKDGEDQSSFLLTTTTTGFISAYFRLSDKEQVTHLLGQKPVLLSKEDAVETHILKTICPPNPEIGYCYLGDSAIKVIYQK